MRLAVINRDKCRPKACGYTCIRVCPGVRMGEKTITQEEETGFPVINEELCTGCGICVKKCPFQSISVINLPEMKDNPIHQYGVNGFRVFGLPTPKKGIVSLIGQNGIGKTTLMKILSGKLVPNLGKNSSNWDEVIEKFKGKEVQNYLLALKNGEVTASFKPQEVDKLANFKGSVLELGKNVGCDENRLRGIAEEMGISDLLNRQVAELSGGELQKTAILLSLAKDADLYFLDEPSSFLDIKERMKLAKLLSKRSEEKMFMLVEHDLVVLDFLSDWVHVLYGKPGVYGIVSTLKSARNGINEYLNGFLKAENMRIREHAIKFEVKPPAEGWKGKTLTKYPSFTKTYSKFKLTVDGGKLKKGEIVGVVGPNAIGKSTFMDILAGKTSHDNGKIEIELNISYKPQYISMEFDGTVSQLTKKTDINQEIFNTYLKKELSGLMNKNVNDLSGGELQMVSIGLALSRPSNICLLDEPSAFLDIEQRLRFSEIIRTITQSTEKTTVVVDHDITFIDYISDRLIVFDGTPGKEGHAYNPADMRDGMNKFLSNMGVTFRRDPDTGRPRENKPGSQKDRQQKKSGEYYYTLG